MNTTTSSYALTPESHFRRLYEEAPLPYQSLNAEGRLLEVNRAWEKAFGYTREEVLGRFIGDFHVPGSEDKLRQGLEEFKSHGLITGFEVEFLCQDGTHKLMSVSGRIARDNQGRFLRTHCILNDITARKEIEKALQDSEEKYRLAMEATQDGLWDWNVATGSVYYSPGWSRILGEKDIRNDYSTWENRIHPEDKPRILKSLRTHLDGETPAWQEEHRLRGVDGAWIWVLGKGQVAKRDRHGNPLRMVGTMSDINTRKQAETTLAKAKEAAEQASKSKSRFLAAASHDLRQPVQAIASYTDLLAISNAEPALASTIQQLRNATLAMQVLLEGLLDISKLDSGTMRPEPCNFSISSLLSQIQELHQPIAMEKGITLKHVPCTAVVNSDPALLRVIIQNLISNAIKYTHRGKVIIGCRHRGDQLRIEVWDTGIGIPEEKQESIFEEFYQVDNPGRDRSKGIGIGLAIVKRIATLLNHQLYMHSVAGKGSRFAIQVPLAGIASDETHAAQPGIIEFHDDSTSSSILLIEDDEIVLHANHGLLEVLGYKVIPACDAEAAMQQMESGTQPPDIIISDYRLSGDCDGTELVQQLRDKAGCQTPAIILTGDISVTDDSTPLPDNCLWMQKPVRIEELVRAINQLLGNPVVSDE
jgi:PAS domain S-box-containing protein